MCGRYDLSQSPQMLKLYFRLAVQPEQFGNTDIRPTNWAPIIREQEGQRLALPARWGLIPSWAKDAKIAQHTFNARAETVAEKPAFRAAFKRRRCLVPATAFYEWRAIPGEKRKQKLRFASPAGNPLAIAGLWESWHEPESDAAIQSYTVITTTANASMAPIHDRMPVILDGTDWDAWLDPAVDNPMLLRAMLQPCPDEWLQTEAL